MEERALRLKIPSITRPGRGARGTARIALEDLPGDRRSTRRWLYEHQVPESQRISVLEGRHPGSRVLIVGTGPSAKAAIPFDDRLHRRYDVVIALNGSVLHLHSMDYFLSVESKAYLWDWYHYRTPPNVIRCVSESGTRLAREAGHADDQPALYLLRHIYQTPVDIRHYRNPQGEEGLLVGPRGETGLGPGTVTLAAMHFASMLGARSIHVIGADLHFHGPVQHFYGENEYGTHEVDGKRYHRLDAETRLNPIVLTTHPETGETVETTLHFRESATFIDGVIRDLLTPAGVEVVDFSHGLISAAQRMDIAEWMAASEPS
ncbi:MAG TPA: hypothetical protein VGJ46_04310 [Candidatus Limnocylindrales bacterium]